MNIVVEFQNGVRWVTFWSLVVVGEGERRDGEGSNNMLFTLTFNLLWCWFGHPQLVYMGFKTLGCPPPLFDSLFIPFS